jgi:putative peptidoglycan lipid II flippase
MPPAYGRWAIRPFAPLTLELSHTPLASTPTSDFRPPTFLAGFWVTSLGTLASRVLGLVRDMATAALLGLGSGGAMDAFVVAFRIPNLFRRLFGEGALAASYLPVLAERLHHERASAWQLTSVVLTWLTIVLSVVVLVGEALCGALWLALGPASQERLLVGLLAIMLPYLLLGCLAAQVSATLQALGQFRMPAVAPTIMNLCWIVGAWWIAPAVARDEHAQAHWLAVFVLIGGLAQLAVQWPALLRLGFRFDYNWTAAREPARRVALAMLPLAAGYSVTQINTLIDSLLAWGLSAPTGGPQTIAWLGHRVAYPMQQGAAAAVYYGERFYQFPLGVLGLAVATVIFPRLAQHAVRGERGRVADELSAGLRFVWFLSLPAGVGLMMLAEPLARLCFERGEFTPADTERAGRMIYWYSTGVWAYCSLPVLARGFYALGDRKTQVVSSLLAVGVNLAMNLVLIWPLAERGLALSTAAAAALQTIVLASTFSRRLAALDWRAMRRSLVKTSLATAAMAIWTILLLRWLPPGQATRGQELFLVLAIVASAVAVYALVAWLVRHEEMRLLFKRR